MRTQQIFITGLVTGVLGTGMLGLVRAQPEADRRAVNLPGRTTQNPLFSDAIQVGDTLYLAGRLGLDPATGEPPTTPQDEARNVLGQIQAVLEEADMTMDDLVNVQVFCSDVAFYDDFNTVYRTFFTTDDPPARAFLGAGTLLRGARFEVTGIAVRR
ncbi:MAG: Rid family hydrolase [Acidobacteriota bacterium]|nr:Rid family hydrolase [Acidobacteriota bacterium]